MFLLGVGFSLVPVGMVVHAVGHAERVVEPEIVGFDLPLFWIGIENRITKSVDDMIRLRAGVVPLLFLLLTRVGQRLGDGFLCHLLDP